MTYFCLGNFSVPTYHRIDPTEVHSHPVVEIDPVAHSEFAVVGWLKVVAESSHLWERLSSLA